MSVDPSLKVRNALARHRNVLTRAERIEVLKDEDRWTEEQSVLGLPKVAHRKIGAGKKSKGGPGEADGSEAKTPSDAAGA